MRLDCESLADVVTRVQESEYGAFVAFIDAGDYHSLQMLQVYEACHSHFQHPTPLLVLDVRGWSDTIDLASVRVFATPTFQWLIKPTAFPYLIFAGAGLAQTQIIYRAVGTVMLKKLTLELDLLVERLGELEWQPQPTPSSG